MGTSHPLDCVDTTVQHQHETCYWETEWQSWLPLTSAGRRSGALARGGKWSRGNNSSKLSRNTGGTRTRTNEEGKSIYIVCWVETGGGIHKEMEWDWRISGEPAVARKQLYEVNGAITAGSYETPHCRWSSVSETENGWTSGNGVNEQWADKKHNWSCIRTQQITWKGRNIEKLNGAVLLTGNICGHRRLEENLRVVQEESTSTVW